MKLTENEQFALRLLVEDPLITNKDIAKKLKITSQGVGKIRKQLYKKGIIKSHELRLDYEKLGVNILAIAMIKKHNVKALPVVRNGKLIGIVSNVDICRRFLEVWEDKNKEEN